MPTLPEDVLRMIWQAKWRDEAACMLQHAWRACRMRRAWNRMRGRWVLVRYVLKYIAKGDESRAVPVIEYQSRGVPHMHVPVSIADEQ